MSDTTPLSVVIVPVTKKIGDLPGQTPVKEYEKGVTIKYLPIFIGNFTIAKASYLCKQYMQQTAIIIGAGPAGLTAAYELLTRTSIIPIVIEQSNAIGGISQTINYKGNRIDIGGHRFFSKNERVMQWWQAMLPTQVTEPTIITYHNTSTTVQPTTVTAVNNDKVLLVRNRQSRIYYLKQFFSYPVTLSIDTIKKLGIVKIVTIGVSYITARVSPIKDEHSLEHFFINRFGKQLYLTFFKDYTEKVWGVPCTQISASWGAQRIKELNISQALWHAVKQTFARGEKNIAQKNTNTSLIEKFLYPKYGPGQMWETAAEKIELLGGTIIKNQTVTNVKLNNTNNGIHSVTTTDAGGNQHTYQGTYYFSTMAIKDMYHAIPALQVPATVHHVATSLQYRDFIIVGLLVSKLTVQDKTYANPKTKLVNDNWIYIQDSSVQLGRLQVFNNWSPHLVADNENTVWLGLEYFCNVGDSLWQKSKPDMIAYAISELQSIGVVNATDVLDSTCVKMEKTYPAYFGSYSQFSIVQNHLNTIANLYCVGRNGMHKYNNSDHSMLTAMIAVDNIIAGTTTKDNIWAVNTEQDYHEEK